MHVSRTLRAAGSAALLAAIAACGGGGARPAEGPRADALAAADSAGRACPPVDSAALRSADIVVEATVQAREVRFREAPRGSVKFPGAGARDTLSCDVRANLDRPVRPGRTYRNVRVDYRLMVRLDSAAAPADSARPDSVRRPR
jgi:hypothetical protein